MSLETVKTAIFTGNAVPSKTREDILNKIVNMPSHQLVSLAAENGDEDLRKVSSCGCVRRLQRMTTVCVSDAETGISFEEFTAMVLGESHGNPQKRGRPVRRRR